MDSVQPMQPASNLLGAQVVVVSCVFYVLALAAVVLRVVAKFIRRARFASHDYLIFVALLACTGSIATIIVGVENGKIGLHVTQVTDDEIVIALKTLFVGSWTWIVATVAIKLSILRLYLDLFTPSRLFRMTCHFLELLAVLFIIGIILTVAVVCRPVQKNWYPLLPGTCGDRLGEEVAAATGVFVLDLALILVPMPILWKLKMPMQKKLVISVMFSMGVVYVAFPGAVYASVVTNVTRSVMGINIARIVITVQSDQLDFTFSNAYAFTFASLETFVGTVVACLPTLAPLFNPSRYRRGGSGYGHCRSPKPGNGGGTIGSARVTRRKDMNSEPLGSTFERLGSESENCDSVELVNHGHKMNHNEEE